MRDPNFLVIGAQKCGTTWLSEMLRQHPDVYTPGRKELHFFDRRENYERGIEWYRTHFGGATTERAIGECTPNYLWVQEACPTSIPGLDLPVKRYDEINAEIPRLVHEAYPDLRLIVVLRNPVDRAVSSFRHHIRMRRLPPRSNILEVGGELGILGMGFYTHQLLAWEKFYPRERFLVLIYEQDVRREPGSALRRTFEHIGVDPDFTPARTDTRFNARSSDAFMFARYYSPRLARAAFSVLPILNRLGIRGMGVSGAERRALSEVFAEETYLLERHLGRSLPEWRPPVKASDP